MRKMSQEPISFVKKLCFVVPLLIVVFTVLADLTMTAQVSGAGVEISSLESKALSLEKNNASLQLQLAQKESLSVAKAQAQALGFVPREKVVEVRQTNTLASTIY